MKVINIIGIFVSGLIAISAFSLVVAPHSQMAQVVAAFGKAGSDLISTAKALPGGN